MIDLSKVVYVGLRATIEVRHIKITSKNKKG
ncbi:hypothetical protein CMALT394_420015 [Carnobacterium maltaromaticum]|nr:hypothetical protein CMALT394_420015 [Carnobacterium maltaromaticum]